MTAERWVVRLRAGRTCWTSAVMTEPEADSYREGLRAQVIAAGDGAGMVDFAGLGGRHVSVRARDVVSVETARWIEQAAPAAADRDEHPHASGGHVVGSIVVQGGPAPDGTGYLRAVAGIGSRQPVVR